MIQKLQKIFHTDKWWGKSLFVFLVYTVFWFVFYGGWILLTYNWREFEFDVYKNFVSFSYFFLLIFLPIFTFLIFPKFLKKFLIKKTYLINSIFIFITLISFLFIELLISMKNWFNFS